MFGSIISAIGGIAGSLLGNQQRNKELEAAQVAQREAWARDDSAIQRRVADAKAAGIHPLAALGAPLSGSSFAAPVGSTDTGAAIGDAISEVGRGLEAARDRELAEMELRSRIKVNETSAMLNAARSRTAIAEAQKLSREPDPIQIHSPLGKFTTGPYTAQQDVEDEYGGIIGEAYGVGRAAREGVDWLWERSGDAAKAIERRRRIGEERMKRYGFSK